MNEVEKGKERGERNLYHHHLHNNPMATTINLLSIRKPMLTEIMPTVTLPWNDRTC
jgi:hypothetical protein